MSFPEDFNEPKGRPNITVGTGASIVVGSDRYPGTVICVSEYPQLTVWIRGDHSKIIRGSEQDGSAVYEFSENPNGTVWAFRWDKKTLRWRELQKNHKTGNLVLAKSGLGVWMNNRSRYCDPHF